MTFERRTLSQSVSFDGLGLHSGTPVQVNVHPSDGGIEFRCGSERVIAKPSNVTDTSRCTRLGTISMVEHMMSSLAALEITDAIIEVSTPELPGLDGSAIGYYEHLKRGGITAIGEKTIPELFKRVFFQDLPLTVAVGKGNGHWRFVYDNSPAWPGVQAFESTNVIDDFPMEIAPARTIVLEKEIPIVQQMGLGKGLDESSVLIVGEGGYCNQARFPDEPARHKLLDLLGDIYLSGVPVRMLNVVSERSGHRSNVRVAQLLSAALHL